MSMMQSGTSQSADRADALSQRRWLGLACISVAQLMVALDS